MTEDEDKLGAGDEDGGGQGMEDGLGGAGGCGTGWIKAVVGVPAITSASSTGRLSV